MPKQKPKTPRKTVSAKTPKLAEEGLAPGGGPPPLAEAARPGKPPAKKAAPAPKRSKKLKAKAAKPVSGAAPTAAVAKDTLKALLKPKLPRKPTRLPPLERLEAAIEEVKRGARSSPRTRKLLGSGVPKMAQKLIEEAGEVAIEALQAKTGDLVNETVDLFYNTLVLLNASGVKLEMLWAEMERRERALGLAEKLPKPGDGEA